MRGGFSLLEVVLAVALLVAALVPLIEAARSGAATVRPREEDLLVTNLAGGVLERLAAAPVMPDDLRDQLGAGAEVTGPDLVALCAEVFGALPGDLSRTLREAGVRLKIERAQRLALTGADGRVVTGLEEWTATVSWTRDGRPQARRFTRVTAQG